MSKYLLRHGRRPTVKMKPWTQRYLQWIRKEVRFEQHAQQISLEDYLEELNHQAQRIRRLETAIDEAIAKAPEAMRGWWPRCRHYGESANSAR